MEISEMEIRMMALTKEKGTIERDKNLLLASKNALESSANDIEKIKNDLSYVKDEWKTAYEGEKAKLISRELEEIIGELITQKKLTEEEFIDIKAKWNNKVKMGENIDREIRTLKDIN